MPRTPNYPWFPADYLADTLHLTPAQDGIYRRLLDHYWVHGPFDRQFGVKIARISTRKDVANLGLILDTYFHEGADGLMHNSRADREIEKLGRLRKSASKGGLLSPSKFKRGNSARAKMSTEQTPGIQTEQIRTNHNHNQFNSEPSLDGSRDPAAKSKIEKGSNVLGVTALPDQWMVEAYGKRVENGLPILDLRHSAQNFLRIKAGKGKQVELNTELLNEWVAWALRTGLHVGGRHSFKTVGAIVEGNNGERKK
ncbi:MAG: YdaU family protein [Synechococcaceae cyanobacterium SM1_2_3]|nr:YdaU family protein [Synechococcaceae cyanobacterium SM1_2_3]